LKNAWTYTLSLATFEDIEEKFPESANDAVLEVVERLRQQNQKIIDIKGMDDAELVSKLATFLYNYQRIAVKIMKTVPNPLLADDMGVGKTLETICLCEEINEGTSFQDLRVLVVSPNTLKWTWAAEIE